MLKLITYTILILTTSTVFAQPVEKCDSGILLNTSKKVGTLNQREIKDFLLTFGEACRNNAEYAEWSNELLFSILDKQTELTLITIQKEEAQLEINEILNDLTSPISDATNIKRL